MIEHGSSRPGRFLRERRLRIALWIALAEGVLVVLDVIPWWLVFVAAAAAVALYAWLGRGNRSDTVRQTSWIAASSQVLVALVPVLMLVLTAVAVAALVVLGLVALVLLLVDRR
jgi:hypothetical protein